MEHSEKVDKRYKPAAQKSQTRAAIYFRERAKQYQARERERLHSFFPDVDPNFLAVFETQVVSALVLYIDKKDFPSSDWTTIELAQFICSSKFLRLGNVGKVRQDKAKAAIREHFPHLYFE